MKRRRRMLIAAAVVVSLLAIGTGALWLVQRRLIYFPGPAPEVPARLAFVDGRDVELTTADGLTLDAWLASAAAQRDRGFVVLSAPGNAGSRFDRRGLGSALADAGFTVLLMDYRGYGGNPGRPTEEGLRLDVRAGRDFLLDAGWRPDQIIYLGESLGCAPLTWLATREPPAGLVLRSPFRSLAAAANHHFTLLPAGLLLRDRYPVADLIGGVTVPTVVVYGTADTVVPPEQSRHVAERAGGPVEVVAVEGADHNDVDLAEGRPLIDAMVALADRLSEV